MMLSDVTTPPTTTPTKRDLLHDPQFWIATVIALVAVVYLTRALLPKFGVRLSKGSKTQATLTVGGKALKK